MNVKIMEALGFGEEVVMVGLGICPLCRKEVKGKDFDGAVGWKEYQISGLCPSCQDEFFNTKLTEGE